MNPNLLRLNVAGQRFLRGERRESESELLLARDPAPIQRIQAPELSVAALLPGQFNHPTTVPIRDELKYANFSVIPLTIGTGQATKVLLKPAGSSRRTYLAIYNTDGVNQLFFNFGQNVTALTGVPLNMGEKEIYNNVVPQDDVYIIATGANTLGILVYANDTVVAAGTV